MSDQQICRMTKPPRLPPVIFCDMMISTKTYGTLGYNITEQEFILKKKEVLFIAGILVFALVLWGFPPRRLRYCPHYCKRRGIRNLLPGGEPEDFH